MALTTSQETLGKDRVKLTVEVPEEELRPAMDAVYRRWATEIKMPGFRKGKIPRQLIDQRVGKDVILEEALRDALPDLYRAALADQDLEAIAPPDIEVTRFSTDEPVVFEATVDLRPQVEVPDLTQITVQAPPSEVTDEEIDAQMERLRDRFAELEPVGREARRGDHVLIDLKGYRGEELLEGASAPDYLYEVGSRTGPPSLDEQLEGARPGAILRFTDEIHFHDGTEHEHDHDHSSTEPISFTVLVKEVKTKSLPVLDDEFAKTVGEFDSLDELRADLKERLAEMKVRMVHDEVRGLVLNALVDASDLEAPDKLVESELNHRLEHVEEDLRRAGMTLGEYAERSGTSELEIRTDMRTQAERSVKAELLLEEVARTQQLDVTQEDLGLEIAYVAAQSQRDSKEVAEEIVQSGRLGALAGDILRRKALDHVFSQVTIEGLPDLPAQPEQVGGAQEAQPGEPTAADEPEMVLEDD